jgi:hypothetical protein
MNGNLPIEILNIHRERARRIRRDRSRRVDRRQRRIATRLVIRRSLDVVPSCSALDAEGGVDSSVRHDFGSEDGAGKEEGFEQHFESRYCKG